MPVFSLQGVALLQRLGRWTAAAGGRRPGRRLRSLLPAVRPALQAPDTGEPLGGGGGEGGAQLSRPPGGDCLAKRILSEMNLVLLCRVWCFFERDGGHFFSFWTVGTVTRSQDVLNSALLKSSIYSSRVVDPDPCGSWSRRVKLNQKNRKRLRIFMFWSAGYFLSRAERFSCTLGFF